MPRLFFFLVLFSLWSANCTAQFNWVEIGVDGLTCSQCSRSVEMEIRKLDFVREVQMDLQHTQGKITFDPGTKVRIEKIARAVKEAGFSVRYLKADFSLDTAMLSGEDCLPFENRVYQIVKPHLPVPKGEVIFKFIGKDFLPKSEYREWQQQLIPKCQGAEKLFYVILS